RLEVLFEWKFLPYCLQQREDGRYILLNRDYKALGYVAGEDKWVDYEKWPEAFDIKITPAEAAKMSVRRSRATGSIYFYDDGCPPWAGAAHRKAYYRRVARLFFPRRRSKMQEPWPWDV